MTTLPGQVQGVLLTTLLLGLAAGQPFISLTGPSQRMTPGASVPFNCTAGSFSSQEVNVTWLKDRAEIPASAQRLVVEDKGNYSVTSKAWVTLTQQDVTAKIICIVTHQLLAEPLQGSMELSTILRIVPTVKVSIKPSATRVHVHEQVNLTCQSDRFYPSHLRLTWMENGHTVQSVLSPQVTKNSDGTYSLKHILSAEVKVNASIFACWLTQDNYPPVCANITLKAHTSRMGKGRSTPSYLLHGPLQRSTPGTSIQLTITSWGIITHQVTVTWLKDDRQLSKPLTSVLPSGNTFNVSSSVLILLKEDDVLASVHCYVKHDSVLAFYRTISLDQYLRVPPTVTMSQSSTSSETVAVVCHVQRFYPQTVHLTMLDNCQVLKEAGQHTPRKNVDGTFTLTSTQMVNTSAQHSDHVFACKVQHETQPPIWANLVLSPAAHTTYKSTGSPGSGMPALIFVAFLLGLKLLLVVSFMLVCSWKRWNP